MVLKGLYYGFMGDVEKGIDCYDVGLHIDSGDANGWLYKGGFLKIAKNMMKQSDVLMQF